ncbi:hypothetical protein Cgig2_016571 [Carnegiea gigantea]|uniref:Uncharacterized protein n=1 Tax=Carnegiea gigantea TaxID=171969 RepID=A0A9Q1KZM5_9CARY|nr:hypothetical protein Cgig2_016571 [Carnegiea gigantea]
MSDIPPLVSNIAVHSQNANLLNSARLSHDGYPSGSQLPTNLDGGTTHSPGCKNQQAILTFSRAWEVFVVDLSRTRPECHVHTTSGNMESTNKPKKRSRLPSANRKHGILPTPSRFSAPKVTAVRTEATPTIVISDRSSRGNSRSKFGAYQAFLGLDEGLNPLPTYLPDQDSDLPIDEDDEMDIFLNLEGDNEPQHSFDSLKKRRPDMDSAQGLLRFVSGRCCRLCNLLVMRLYL